MAATCQFAIYIDEIVYFLLKLLRADLGCDASFSLFEFLAFIYIYIYIYIIHESHCTTHCTI